MPISVILLLLDLCVLVTYAFAGKYIKFWLGESVFVFGYLIALIAPIGIIAVMSAVPVVQLKVEPTNNNKEKDK